MLTDAADREDTAPVAGGKLDRRLSAWLGSLRRLAAPALRFAIAAPILAGTLLVAQMWALSRVLSQAVEHDAPAVALMPGMVLILALIVLRAVVIGAGERSAARAAERIKKSLRLALFEHMLGEGPRWTRQRVSGELASSLLDHVEALDGFFSRYLPSMAAAVFVPLAFSVLLLPLDWVAGLILLLSAPLIPVFMALVGWRAEAASRRHQQALSRLSGFFADRVHGAFTLKLLGRVEAEIEVVGDASRGLSRKTMAVLRIAFLSSAVLELFAALGVAGVALYVGLGYLGYLGDAFADKSLQIGMFCLFLAPEVYQPLRQFAAHYHDRAAARAAVDQLAGMFETLPPVIEGRLAAGLESSHAVAQSPRAAPDGESILRVRGLRIRTPEGATVLEEVDLCVHRGCRVALMGASGSGKTSLLETVSGWRRPDAGGVVYRAWRPPPAGGWTCRDGMVLIGRHVFFPAGTIGEHVRMADRAAPDQAVWRALDLACVGDVVRALPDGLETRLGVGGYGLSGGQLHRIALARLFLTSPHLILLDEPTAHLDAGTRDRVVDSLLAFSRGRAMILATHDAQVARRMDVAYRIENGRVLPC